VVTWVIHVIMLNLICTMDFVHLGEQSGRLELTVLTVQSDFGFRGFAAFTLPPQATSDNFAPRD
jgi:hypothetical protein